jgi:hypothetical protein
MAMRRGWVGLAGVVVAAGVALADKPAGLPIDPLVEGREPTPLAREFHEPDRPPQPPEAVSGPAAPRPIGELVEVILSLVTFQLGTVPVGEPG